MEKGIKEKEEEIINFAKGEKQNIDGKIKENKILRNFFVGVLVCVIVLISVVLFINSVKSFKYNGLEFSVEKFGEIITYRTALPLYSQTGVSVMTGDAITEHTADYNFYLRNDPRKLGDIPTQGEVVLYKEMVINSSEELNCEGDAIIGMKNLITLYEVLGTNVIRDENAGCDEEKRYMFLNIQPGEVTKLEQVTPSCYNIYVNNCEILDATERFMIETLIKVKQKGLKIMR